MTSMARRLLDELMGTDRNKPLHLRAPKQHRFTSSDVCKHYLVDFCPFELFMNTKSDVGPCPYKIHDAIIKGEFERDGESFRQDYERRFVGKLEDLVGELERRLRRGKERLETTGLSSSSNTAANSNENDEVEEKKILLAGQIKEMLRAVESLGEQGKIGEAREMSVRAERLKEELERLKQLDLDNSDFRIERKLQQCSTCGAMLVVNDAPLRIQSHYEGRQHNGWLRVRQTLEEWKLKAPEYFGRADGHRHHDSRHNDRHHRHQYDDPRRYDESHHYHQHGHRHYHHDRDRDRDRIDRYHYSSSSRRQRGD